MSAPSAASVTAAPAPGAERRDAHHPAGPGQPELRMYAALRREAPGLAESFLACLPGARGTTARRVVAAAWREDVGGLRGRGRLITTTGADADRDGHLADLLADLRPGRWAVSDLPGAGTLAFPVLAEHAFGRVAVGDPVVHVSGGRTVPVVDPGAVVALLAAGPPEPAEAAGPAEVAEVAGPVAATARPDLAWAEFAAEVTDGATNLALATARAADAGRAARRVAASLGATDCLDLAGLLGTHDPAFEPTVFLEKLATGGHTLHPCARTRLGMGPSDLLRHDVEAGDPTELALVGVRRDQTVSAPDPHGRDVGDLLLDAYPVLAAAVTDAGVDPAAYLLLPVHRWQLDRVVRVRYAEQIARGDLLPVPGARLRAEPTMALRTLLTEPGRGGRRFFVKTALDVQVTSTRRTISVQTATNGPVFSALLGRVVAGDPVLSRRVVLLPELAGASYREDRSLTALVRADFTGRLRPGELAVPGCALYARSPLGGPGRSVLAELVDRYAAHREEGRTETAARLFLTDYAAVLLGPTLRLLTRYGIGMEAHLQNAIPIFVNGVPTRIAFRDWGGLRVHLPRLARRGHHPALRPGSLTVTRDVAVARAKVAYTVLQNHLAEIVLGLGRSHALDERAGWEQVRVVLGRVLAGLAAEAEQAGDVVLTRDVASDTRALGAPTLPHKALLTMRLYPDGGDRYVQVPNPLRGPW